ncbi:MAG: hypothetical protein RL095_433 [Verrucomicrobiota bacterium]|jgi:nitrite reductase (NADH) large subunit
MKDQRKTLIVVGNGMVGHKFCERFSASPAAAEWNLIVFGEEPRPAYDRVHLSEYFAGRSVEDLTLGSKAWYAERGIELRCGERILALDRERQCVVSDQGAELHYDALVLATGSAPFVPTVPGVNLKGIFVYRTIEDLDAIRACAHESKTCAVIGGGLLGLEAAKAAQDLGLKTSVVEFAPRLMPRQLDEGGGAMLLGVIKSRGIEVLLNRNTKHFVDKNGAVDGLEFVDGSALQADMVIISAGIRPRDELARSFGLEVGPRGGIQVDDAMRTSDAKIYAIGECALHRGMIYGLVAPGYQQADVAAAQILGRDVRFNGADLSAKLKLIGTDVASFGNIEPKEAHYDLVVADRSKGVYKKIFVTADGKRLLGGILVGDASDYGSLLQLYLNAMPLPAEPLALIAPAVAGGGHSSGPLDLPDTATICSCENVSKATICAAIDSGCGKVPELKKCTKAGTGCGGCVPLVTDLLKAYQKSKGLEVSEAICEHFPHSRVALNAIVRASGIKSFETLIAKHGQGHGCEICKPAVASILASTWNEPILKHAPLQDTNDVFLANIQKDGTYSVVPRVPGGEITADKLIVIGEVAKKYSLYVKITGGQRIDLLGAHLGDLPAIWSELIAAGFESGHAYGKALRTVKSCVGSTWCRYGVQDSTSMAIRIEERYRGLRSPHKLKSAVSGCTRECAEAQSKDFGVIATEKGWNLYVCGNGGMKPRHADLLAGDLDDATLIKYIDRFLMYYIKTADRLNRTSTWLDKLPGGLAHLKDVILNDSLGICEELEAQMQQLVDTYECEWKNAVNDPEKLKRFNHFVNSDERDPTQAFASERGQIRPLSDAERAAAGVTA